MPSSDIKTNSLVKLDGRLTQRKEKTVSLKSDYFKFLQLNLDQYENVEFTEEEAKRVRTHMSHLVTGASAVLPLICPGEVKCPFAHNCPFVKVDKQRMREYEELKRVTHDRLADISPPKKSTPVGRHCLVEVNLLKEWAMFYIEEFEVGDNSFIELNTCQELAEIEVMLWRLNNNLAKVEHMDLTQLDVVGTDREGNPLTRKSENVLMLAKERLINRKSKLIKLMVGDRQEKYKREAALKQRDDKDPSTTAAQLRGEITRMMKQLEGRVLQLQEAEGNVIDVESTEPKEQPMTPDSLINEMAKEE